MKERPILFSTEMVKAILDCRKTMTRRVVKPQSLFEGKDGIITRYPNQEGCPYGQVGDRLWVRETFCYKRDPITAITSDNEFWYRATNPEVIKIDDDGSHAFRKDGWSASPWLPSIHMPRKASRITLEITNIRVERVQDITAGDTVKEGVTGMSFQPLWDSINAKRGYSWQSNPWVWVIEFRQVKKLSK